MLNLGINYKNIKNVKSLLSTLLIGLLPLTVYFIDLEFIKRIIDKYITDFYTSSRMWLNGGNTNASKCAPRGFVNNRYDYVYFWNTRYNEYLTDVRSGFTRVSVDFAAAIVNLKSNNPVASFTLKNVFSIAYMGNYYNYNTGGILKGMADSNDMFARGFPDLAWVASDLQRNTVISELEIVRNQFSQEQATRDQFMIQRKMEDQAIIKQKMDNIIN
jgi:hypothetical protein